MASKYDKLREHLLSLSKPEWSASFAEIERVLGFELPPSARTHRAWWANQEPPPVQAGAWWGTGWSVQEVSLDEERVRFCREVQRRAT